MNAGRSTAIAASRFLGVSLTWLWARDITDGLARREMPGTNQLIKSAISYHIRPGQHDVTAADWRVFVECRR
jgi:hypothetical protein